MTIDPVNNLQSVSYTQQNAPVKNDAPQTQASTGSFEKTAEAQKQEALVAQLAGTDDVRAEAIKVGKSVLADNAPPSEQELSDLAQALLAPIVSAE